MQAIGFSFWRHVLPAAILLTGCCAAGEDQIHLAQGALAGEVSATDVILQTRLTAGAGLTDGDVPGAAGVGCFEISENAEFKAARRSPWLEADAAGDFILKAKLDGLQPRTRYYYRVIYGRDREHTAAGPACSFQTLPATAQSVPLKIIVASCMSYAQFHIGLEGKTAYQGADKALGYPTLEAMIKLQPDLWVGAGDNVYYDHPVKPRAVTQAELRRKWHEQYVQPRFVKLFSNVATYWLKDDHDYRFNDADPYSDGAPSHELGIKTFIEQVPRADPADTEPVPYRTLRLGRDLQIWMTEGRDYRSANRTPDGPEKSMWGAEQNAWLRRTLLQSDAAFKILITPSPMVGPDDAKKLDNHVNPKGFRHEADTFFAWLKENGVSAQRFFIVSGDRHWKYHSVHPSGYEEFCTGALNAENARLGRKPGDPQSTDPGALVKQPYTDANPSGGFVGIELLPDASGQSSSLEFIHYDETGAVLNRVRKTTR